MHNSKENESDIITKQCYDYFLLSPLVSLSPKFVAPINPDQRSKIIDKLCALLLQQVTEMCAQKLVSTAVVMRLLVMKTLDETVEGLFGAGQRLLLVAQLLSGGRRCGLQRLHQALHDGHLVLQLASVSGVRVGGHLGLRLLHQLLGAGDQLRGGVVLVLVLVADVLDDGDFFAHSIFKMQKILKNGF